MAQHFLLTHSSKHPSGASLRPGLLCPCRHKGALPLKFLVIGAVLAGFAVVAAVAGFALATQPDPVEEQKQARKEIREKPPFTYVGWGMDGTGLTEVSMYCGKECLKGYCDNVWKRLARISASLTLDDLLSSAEALGRIRHCYALNVLKAGWGRDRINIDALFSTEYNNTSLDVNLKEIADLLKRHEGAGNPLLVPEDFAEVKDQVAAFYFLLGRWPECLPCLDRHYKKDAQLINRYRMAQALAARKVPGIEAVKKVLAAEFKGRDNLVRAALDRFDQRDYAQAAVLAEAYLAENKVNKFVDFEFDETACFCVFLMVSAQVQGNQRLIFAGDDNLSSRSYETVVGHIRGLVKLGRLYHELGRLDRVQEIKARLVRQFPDQPLAEYGVALLDHLGRDDMAGLATLLGDARREKLLGRVDWTHLTTKDRRSRPGQALLLTIAQMWDALGETEHVGRVMEDLRLKQENELHHAYLLYVDALYKSGRMEWAGAAAQLEKLQAFAMAFKGRNGHEMPGLSVADMASLYEYAKKKEHSARKVRRGLESAEAQFNRLVPTVKDGLNARFTAFRVNAGLLLVQGYLNQGQVGRANAVLSKVIPLWLRNLEEKKKKDMSQRTVKEINIFLERDYLQTVSAMYDGIRRGMYDIGWQRDDRRFRELTELLGHLRTITGDIDVVNETEVLAFEIYKNETDRLRLALDRLPPEAEADRRKILEGGPGGSRGLKDLLAVLAATGGSRLAGPLDRAKWMLEAGSLDAARDLLKNPASFEGHYWLAEVWRAKGDFDKAIVQYQEVREKAEGERPPLFWDSLLGEGRCLMALGRYSEAASVLARPYGYLAPGNSTWNQSLYYRSLALFHDGMHRNDKKSLIQGLALFEEINRRFPQGTGQYLPDPSGVDLVDLARFYGGKTEAAIARLTGGQANTRALFTRAASRFDRLAKRLEKQRRTRTRHRLWHECLMEAADAYFSAEQWYQAIEFYKKYWRLNRGHPACVRVYFQLGQCAEALENAADARDWYQRGKELLTNPQFTPSVLEESLPPFGPGVKNHWDKRFSNSLKFLDNKAAIGAP